MLSSVARAPPLADAYCRSRSRNGRHEYSPCARDSHCWTAGGSDNVLTCPGVQAEGWCRQRKQAGLVNGTWPAPPEHNNYGLYLQH